MYVARKTAKRFSLLLLDDGEDYIQEYVCACRWPGEVEGNWKGADELPGTLRLCSKSLFFDADDVRVPVIRISFLDVQSLLPDGAKAFALSTCRLTKMKQNGADHPYLVEKGRLTAWRFSLPYANFDRFMGLAMEQLALKGQQGHLEEKAREREDAASFDTSRLVDFSERILYEGPATQLTPLVREPGKMVITGCRLYFQPLHTMSGNNLIRTHPLSDVAAVARRRSSLRHIGMEVFFVAGVSLDGSAKPHDALGPMWDSPSAFFAFRTREEREKVIGLLLDRVGSGATRGAILEARGRWLKKVMAAWQRGKISTFDYLLYLNLAAGRSFNDLTQWPVFPWVLADYTSEVLDLSSPATFRDLTKPVGALNASRLQMFRDRHREMPDESEGYPPKFLYGTHYSTPGYVMFWLVRAAPAHMLQLQNGRFDSPDRLFYSMRECWESVLNNPADVKELIPEFFLPNDDFLLNRAQLALGKRQNGRSVCDVEMPPWADSPPDFLAKHRAALESPYVSAHLHKWIDLIFGCKQKGQAAVEADNLFFYLSYEGAVDIEKVIDPVERRALEAQINEFGQTPMQLFSQPHPPRLICPPAPDPDDVFVAGTPLVRSSSNSMPDLGFSPAAAADTDGQALTLALLSAVVHATESEMDLDAGPDSPAADHWKPGEASTARDVPAGRNSSYERPVGAPTPTDSQPSTSGPYAEVLGQWAFIGKDHMFKKAASARQTRVVDPSSGIRNLRKGVTSVTDKVRGMDLGSKFTSFVGQLKGQAAWGPRPSGGSASTPSDNGQEGGVLQPSGWWADCLPHRMAQRHTLRFQQEAVNAVATSSSGGGTLYCAGHGATLRLFSLETGAQVRSARLELNPGSGIPLSSIALLPQGSQKHPLVLTGSYDNTVYAYSADYGRLVGHFGAHDDVVSVVHVTCPNAGAAQQLITASWDGSVKVWRLDEARSPWDGPPTRPLIPVAELSDHESAVWAMDGTADGNVLVTGTNEGVVTSWDVRTPDHVIWRSKLGMEYVGGVCITPDSNHVVAVSEDGQMRVLATRKDGGTIASASMGSPLRCVQTDGHLAVAGGEDGKIHVWDVAQRLGVATGRAQLKADADGLLEPLQCSSSCAVKALSVGCVGTTLWLSAGHDEGAVSAFAADGAPCT
ncbi:unnamed protein product [Ostreobium quekettii]|uniref:Uncharacterized protein n=1 Tax=Ostreobium quekettii TaxID=121088 RepID=A0A8S1INP8_9CHLO|nr:unnamed protein product [Ostreobium quekettii]|eukprot:evm.model.scf_330.3 EVM.evm.TU.scf_330.3   scf_330:30751-34182(-)